DRREAGMKPQHRARALALGVARLLVVGVAHDREQPTRGPGCGLDDVRQVAPARLARLGIGGLGIEVLQLLARRVAVGAQIVVGAAGEALELVPAPREAVLDVEAAVAVVRQLVLTVSAKPQVLGPDADRLPPAHALVLPVLEPLGALAR